MSQTRLKTAILGLNEKGRVLLEAANKSDFFEIAAVADSNPELAEKIGRKYKCASFGDYRQLVIQNRLDVLFVAAPIHLCDEYVRAAMKKKFNILKLIPPGLDFEHTAELMRLAKKERIRFAAANAHRFAPGFCRLRDYLASENTEDFHLITAVYNMQESLDGPADRWLSDPQLAGGGVLLRNSYQLIDQITLNFGIPQQVYSLNTNRAPDRQQRLSITEDTAIVTMRFSDTLVANLIASRVFGPPRQVLTIHGRDKLLTVSKDNFTLCDNLGKIIDELKCDCGESKSTAKMLENFAQSLLSPDKSRSATTKNADLNNMAVIESAYLSTRTAMPEEPLKILDIVRTGPTNI